MRDDVDVAYTELVMEVQQEASEAGGRLFHIALGVHCHVSGQHDRWVGETVTPGVNLHRTAADRDRRGVGRDSRIEQGLAQCGVRATRRQSHHAGSIRRREGAYRTAAGDDDSGAATHSSALPSQGAVSTPAPQARAQEA